MRLSYDEEGDVLEVIFDERLHRARARKNASNCVLALFYISRPILCNRSN